MCDITISLASVTHFLTLVREKENSWYEVPSIPVKTFNQCFCKNNLWYHQILSECLPISAGIVTFQISPAWCTGAFWPVSHSNERVEVPLDYPVTD